jgi:hypothetical protein
MVLTKEKLIYIHIPKTGGISIEEYLQSYYGYQRNAFLFNHGFGTYLDKLNHGATVYPHMHFPLFRIINELSKNNIIVDNTWTIFSIVRNPYSRFLSELFFDNSRTNGFKYNYFTIPQKERNRYLNKNIDEYFNNDSNLNYHSNHSLPQYKFFENTDIDCSIFKFEEGLENILINLGFDAKGKIPHKMNSFRFIGVERPNYNDIYTRYFIEIINDLYYKDFEIYNYKMLDPLDYPLI